MSAQFRLHPEEKEIEQHRRARFSLARSAYDTIRRGGLGSALLLPHLIMPVYGVYVLVNRYNYWLPEFEHYLGTVIALIEGISFGAVIGLSIIRFGASGKAIKGRRIEKTATDEEESKQQRIEVGLRIALYIFLGALLWEYLVHSKYSPMADENSRHTSSGFMTASSHIRKYFNNESVLSPIPEESRQQMAAVGLDWDLREKAKEFKDTLDKGPKIRIPGTKSVPRKSAFLRGWEWAWKKVTRGPRVGLFEIGPRNYP